MKQPYISPDMQTLSIGINQMVAESAPKVGINSEVTPLQGSELDTKETKNLWDEEW